ncbi:transcription factor bHLH96-like [Gastrolobium bilobum]|uniref:transcription factor bHLH96-like n=1 Tax=Gastrolobium bilobum TaxID=150636 RepID=UPI002AB3117F|nr:transcription factor bHLH96-like [Gastrolobium bilobum]
MALEAVVFPQDPFSYGCKDYLYSLLGGGSAASDSTWNNDYGFQATEEKAILGIINNNIEHNLHANWDSSSSSVLRNVKDQWDSHSSSPEACTVDQSMPRAASPLPPSSTVTTAAAAAATSRRKRRRTKSAKNMEEIENQRMTHIAVERNRRKQMNEYLAVLRSLMPPSYVQRGDQASIIGGAINFVKELEQLLQCMKGQKKTKEQVQENCSSASSVSPLAEFFMFPQYSTRATQSSTSSYMEQSQNKNQSWAVADIEVTLVDSHANIKILSKKQPGQIMKMVVGLQSLGLGILHLNVTTVDDMVLTSVSVKVEEGCQLNTVDEIAAAVNQLSRTVQGEAAFS